MTDPGSSISRRCREVAAGLALARVAIGVLALSRPHAAAAPWVGSEHARLPELELVSQAAGGRDLALGLSALLSFLTGRSMRASLAAGALADAIDATVTVAHAGTLPRSATAVKIAAGGAAITALLLLPFVGARRG